MAWMKRYIIVKTLVMFLTLLVGVCPQFGGAHSQRLILGPEVLVSSNQDGGDLRCEPSAAIFKDKVIVAWNDSYGGMHGSPSGTAVGWAISKDRGRTFRFGGYLPLAQNDFVAAAADSRLAVDAAGNFFLEILSWQAKSKHLQLYIMPRNAPEKWRKLPEPVVYQASKGEEYVDKPAMSVSGGNIGIIYTEKRVGSSETISLLLSLDNGQTWSKPIQLSADSKSTKSSSSIVINGKEIVAAWMESPSQVWFASSHDGGKSFSVATQVYQLKRPFTPPTAYRMGPGQMATISNDASLVSVSSPSGDSVYYLSFVEGTENGSDVLLVSYDARTRKWSEPIRLAESDSGPVKIFSSMALIGGSPALLYYKRNDARNATTDVYLSILNEGKHFETLKLNTESSDWALTKGDMKYAPIQRVFGDYITLATDGNSLVAAWTDGRHEVPRIYARVIGTQ